MPERFRLLDLIVVVFVCAVMTGLLLPVLHRDSGVNCRRSCLHQLHLTALGVIQYQTVNGWFPPGATTINGNHFGGTSYLTASLPFLDQSEIYNRYNFSLPCWSPGNELMVGIGMPQFNCPENSRDPIPAREIKDPFGWPLPGRSVFTRGTYAANLGGGRYGFGEDFVKRHGTDRGVMGQDWGAGPAELKDGVSTTILLGEKYDGQGWAIGGWGASAFDVGPTPSYVGDDPRGRRVYTGSPHRNGANFVFCDGSARPLPTSLDRKIWYALITRDGGEAVSKEDCDLE